MSSTLPDVPRLFAALVLFFVSGFAALLYQVTWQRLLVFFSGADVHSVTVVVAAFMAGIGCGSFAGGHLADRVGRVASLALFAAAELAVAVFGYFSSSLFYDVLYTRFGHIQTGSVATAALLFSALLWPTIFMGASLPLLSRGLTRDLDGAAPTIGLLYALNTAGAAAGAFATTWLLLPQLGLEGSLGVAASLNLLCAAAAVPMAFAGRREQHSRTTTAATPSPTGPRPRGSLVRWSLLFAVSGFVGLSLEIVWFRLLGVLLKSTAFTFGSLLAVYLGGLAAGSVAGSVLARRVRRADAWFLMLQAGAGAWAALSLTLFVAGIEQWQPLSWLGRYFAQYDGVDLRGALRYLNGETLDSGHARMAIALYVVLPLFLIGPPTLMAGMSFPLLQRVVQTDLRTLGRRVGILLTANVLGSTIGSFVTGLVLLDWFGTAGTLRLLFVVSASFAVVATLRTEWARRARLLALAGVVVGTALLATSIPEGQAFWARLHGTSPALVIHGEDGSGLSVLRGERTDFKRTVVFVNGLGQSWVPYGGIHTVLGALPAFVHPRPERAALIGLGSGDTLFAMAGRRDLAHITSVEIIAPQITTLRRLSAWQGYPGLSAILADPRIVHVDGDGRRHLRRSRERYDIIQADALRPHSAYAGNLYSDAYFRLLRDRLTPGGLAVSWAPTERIRRTFLASFPFVARHGEIVMGSDRPIAIDAEGIRRRLADRRVTDHFGAAGVNIEELLAPYLAGWHMVGPDDPRELVDLNTDLHPRDEFDLPPLVRLPVVTER